MKADFPSEEAFLVAATQLSCSPLAIKAVAAVESGPYGAFNDDGSPVILFERHTFHDRTNGKYDDVRVLGRPISDPFSGGYGLASEQHQRLQAAVALDRDNALASASWGLFQIMGYNYFRAGHPTLQSFVNAMFRDVDDHLAAFVTFIAASPTLARAIQWTDWATFARVYNGPKYTRNKYDKKMAHEYGKLLLQETQA